MSTILNARGVPLPYSTKSVNHFSATNSGPQLYGTNSHDSLWGDGSVDVTMYGGAGDDIYYLYSSTNRAFEAPGEGVDTIVTWMDYTLPDNFENLRVTGDGRQATGNDADNIILGKNGTQTLDGGKGDDVLKGGAGADKFFIKAGNGSDLILDFTAEDRVRIEGYGITSFADLKARMVQSGTDVRVDLGGGEILVFANTTIDQLDESQFTIDDAPENSVLNAKGVPLFYSGASVNHYSASDAGPELYGSAGNDTMWGDASVDVTMYGGAGDDIYRLYSATNRVSEASDEGVDTIVTWMSYALPDNFENLKVTGNGRYAFGNDADNIVMGGDRSQTLDGGKGDDVLKGGGGADIFNIEAGNGSDLILDFAAEDTVRLNGYGITSFEEVLAGMTQAGNDVHLDLGGGETLVFADTNVGQFEESQFQLQLDRSNFQLTFSDEFNTLDLWNGESGTWDTNFWWGRENGSTLYKNEELQWYVQPDYEPTNPVNPFSTDNGVVTITAERAPEDIRPYIENYEYTSGLLTTYESFAQKYGYFEMRADMPENDGTWPAFWLLPKDQSWPPELDVVEMRGQEPNRLDLTAHTKQTGSQTEILSSVNVSDTSGFHTYGVLWTEDDLVWYFDDVEVARTSTPADMHKEMYLLANLAVGGIAGEPDDGLAVPAEMQIDYIRAYALDDLQTGVAATADSEGTF